MTIDPTVIVAAIGVLAGAIGTAAKIVYTDLKRDRDYWRDTALRAMGHTDKALEVVARAAPDA